LTVIGHSFNSIVHHNKPIRGEIVSVCITPTEQFLAILWREQATLDEMMMMMPALYIRPNRLVGFFSV
jgi:hypothetical protein